MRVVALASQKGGSGKTMLSAHLAVAADRADPGRVALIDVDPLGSLVDWWSERRTETPTFIQTTPAHLAADLDMLRGQGIALAVIDTPPGITMAIHQVIAAADLILVPTRPSPHDLRAVGATIDLCDRSQTQAMFVVNAAPLRAAITRETVAALARTGMAAGVTIHHRAEFAVAMIGGNTVCEADPRGRSAGEIATLWSLVSDRLDTPFDRTTPALARLAGPAAGWTAVGAPGR